MYGQYSITSLNRIYEFIFFFRALVFCCCCFFFFVFFFFFVIYNIETLRMQDPILIPVVYWFVVMMILLPVVHLILSISLSHLNFHLQ